MTEGNLGGNILLSHTQIGQLGGLSARLPLPCLSFFICEMKGLSQLVSNFSLTLF